VDADQTMLSSSCASSCEKSQLGLLFSAFALSSLLSWSGPGLGLVLLSGHLLPVQSPS
jgi:hypothetical protein